MNKAIHLVLAVCIIYFSVSYAQQDPDSQQFKQITDGEFKHIHLHRFPDSKQLITSLMKEQVLIGFGIIQNEIGEVNRVQIGDGFSGDFYTSISPDGKWVLFDARKGRTGTNIWRVGVHGGSPEQITQDGGQMPKLLILVKTVRCKIFSSTTILSLTSKNGPLKAALIDTINFVIYSKH